MRIISEDIEIHMPLRLYNTVVFVLAMVNAKTLLKVANMYKFIFQAYRYYNMYLFDYTLYYFLLNILKIEKLIKIYFKTPLQFYEVNNG